MLTLAKRIIWLKNIFLSQYCVPKCLVWIRPYSDEFLKEGSMILYVKKCHWSSQEQFYQQGQNKIVKFLVKHERHALKTSDNYGLISTTFYKQLFPAKIPKAQKDGQAVSVFLRFWNQRTYKLLVKCWWNWQLYLRHLHLFLWLPTYPNDWF